MDNTQRQQRVIKADKKIRMLLIIAYVVSIVAVAMLVWWILPWGKGKLGQAEPEVRDRRPGLGSARVLQYVARRQQPAERAR